MTSELLTFLNPDAPIPSIASASEITDRLKARSLYDSFTGRNTLQNGNRAECIAMLKPSSRAIAYFDAMVRLGRPYMHETEYALYALDLTTYDGVIEAYRQLCAAKPGHGLFLGEGCYAVLDENGHVYGTYMDRGALDTENGFDFDHSAWDDEYQCWDGTDSPIDMLTHIYHPVYVAYTKDEGQHSYDCQCRTCASPADEDA